MASKKSGTISSHSGHIMLPEHVNRQRVVLTLILNGYFSYAEIIRRTGLTKRKVEVTIINLIKNNMITDETPNVNKFKVYKVTDNGKSFLGGVRTLDDVHKRIVSENVRAKCQVLKLDNIQKILTHENYSFKQNTNWKNSLQYQGRVNNHKAVITIGKTTATLMLTAPPYSETSGALLGYRMLAGINETCFILNEKWDLGLTVPQMVSGEYVIHTPLAEAIMRKTHGKQVKGKFSWVNQSAPLFVSQFESHDPLDPDRILEIPKSVSDIKSKIENIDDTMSIIKSNSTENSFHNNQLETLVANLAESVNKIATVAYQQNDRFNLIESSVSTIAQKLTELLGIVTAKPENQVTSGHNMSPDHKRMFG